MTKKFVLGWLFVACLAVPAAAAGDAAVASNDALAYLNVDIENNPGWVAGIKGGYQ